MDSEEPALLNALGPRIEINGVEHKVLGVVDLMFEDDVRHTVFSVVTLPDTDERPPTVELLYWPSPSFVRMLFGSTPARELDKEMTGQRRRRHCIALHNKKLVGVAIELQDIPNLERS